MTLKDDISRQKTLGKSLHTACRTYLIVIVSCTGIFSIDIRERSKALKYVQVIYVLMFLNLVEKGSSNQSFLNVKYCVNTYSMYVNKWHLLLKKLTIKYELLIHHPMRCFCVLLFTFFFSNKQFVLHSMLLQSLLKPIEVKCMSSGRHTHQMKESPKLQYLHNQLTYR